MNDEFESILGRARKLQAMLEPGSGASEGERQNALALLTKVLASRGFTLEEFTARHDQSRVLRWLLAAPDEDPEMWAELGWKPRHEKALMMLAVHCFWYVTGDKILNRSPHTQPIAVPASAVVHNRKSKAKGAAPAKMIWLEKIGAEMTEVEHADWRACFYYYAPSLVAGLADARRAAATAARAVTRFGRVFVNRHHLFGPDSVPSDRPLSRADLEAMQAACEHIHGDSWQRPAANLADEFLLED